MNVNVKIKKTHSIVTAAVLSSGECLVLVSRQ